MKKDFISLDDCSDIEILKILELAAHLKADRFAEEARLRRKSLALVFQKPSNRTRVSFETGIFQLGGNAIYLAPEDISFGKRESVSDIARTLSRFVDGVIARVFSHKDLLELAQYASVPVINALSDVSHPCQVLADLMTIQENMGRLRRLRLAYIGDGNNMCNSLMVACAKMGIDMTVASPEGYFPSKEYVETAKKIAALSGSSLVLTKSPRAAAEGAHVLYTDTWISMGQESETEVRLKDFSGFQINEEIAALADKNFIFLHCLPAHRGQEVSSAVIDGACSRIFDEAENRLHVQKAVMVYLYS